MSGRPSPTLLQADVLRDFASRVLISAGASQEAAELCAEVFIDADIAGTDTHGIARLSQYAEALASGRVDGHARPEVSTDYGAVITIDGHNAPGPVCLAFATDVAVLAARDHGVAVTTVRGSNHAGAMAWYVQRAATAGILTLVMTGSTKPMVAPPSGVAPCLGTNALAYGMPACEGMLIFDASTSVVPRSKIEAFRRAGEVLPAGWAVGPDGQPAHDAAELLAGIDALSGYSLLPFGGPDGAHKGFGVGLLAEVLCGPIAGARWGVRASGTGPAGVGHFLLCMDMGMFGVAAAELEKRVESLCAELRAVPSAPEQAAVRVPGDRSRQCAATRAVHGIPIPATVLAELNSTAERFKVSPVDFEGAALCPLA